MPDRNALAVGVLGPLDVRVAGRAVAVTAPMLRGLLAGLALHPGTAVPADQLAAVLWGDDPPADERRSLRTYVNRLRGLLGADLITTVRAGYQLEAEPDQVDAVRFVRLLDAAAQATDRAAERALVGTAVALWRGTPFEDVHSAWLDESETPGLVERYLSGVERLADLDVADGRADETVAQLRALAERHPLRESLWLRLIVALARCGRRAEALSRYEIIRLHLAEELGVDPGQELQAVHLEMLTHRSPIRPRATIPRQLPADIDAFTGREPAMVALDKLVPDQPVVGREPPAIAVITGTAGVGKTTLAVHWAHRMADRFPDGQLYANLRGFHQSGPVRSPAEVIRGFLDALGVPASAVPDGVEDQAALYRGLLAERRMLVVLDNARDAEQVRQLLPGAGASMAVVTSRDQLSGLVAAAGAYPVALHLLGVDEARALLTRRLGADRAAAEPGAVAAMVAHCDGLPLALAIVAARAADHPTFPLATLADQLRLARDDLDAFAGGDPATDVRAVFSWSYRTLGAGAARLFRLLGEYPGQDLGAPAAASLAGLPVRRARALLAELTRAHLVTEHAPGRYTLHDLLRVYAAELLHTVDAADQRREATRRLLDHYVQTGNTAALLIYPRDPITPAPPLPGVHPEALADHAQAMAWFTAEHQVMVAAVDLAAGAGFDTHAWQLAWTLYSFFDWQGRWHDQTATQRTALEATSRLGDRAAKARIQVNLAQVNMRLRRYDEAHLHLNEALDLYTQLGDKTGQARTHLNLGQLFSRQDDHRSALEHSLLALDLHRATDHRSGQADALNEVGWCYAMLGEYRRTIEFCDQALAVHRTLDHRHGQATTWDSLAYAHHHLGALQHAVACYDEAVRLYRDLGDRYREAETLARLGDTHHAADDARAARSAWQRALEILDELGHPDADQVRARLR
ncbi:BTAD domain-containing putative transcriptional regulator [Phytohabitans sp. LJ34]|uniref:AfsR/SARP family transcriptional regulator n=1 Tax=Phytohabitans sp. LJ34 TaxID=3452217 RepID=UPI003F8C3FE7